MNPSRVKYVQYTVVWLCGLAFIIYDKVPDKLKEYIQLNDLIGFTIITIGTLIFSLHWELLKTKQKDRVLLSPESLSEALGYVFSRHTRIRSLRVLARSTQHILPNIKERLVSVLETKLLLKDFEENNNIYENVIVDRMIRDWHTLKEANKIKSLSVCKYQANPTIYCVIVDSSVALIGFYYPTERRYASASYIAPIVIEVRDEQSRLALALLSHWFDHQYDYWAEVEAKSHPTSERAGPN